MRPLIEVVPKYVNRPQRPDGKYGNIKLEDGTQYFVPVAMLGQFSEGVPAKVEAELQEWKKGPVNVITKKVFNGEAPVQKNFTKTRMDPADAKGAFITVILKAYVGAGKVPLERTAIAKAREEIDAGYDMSHNPQRADDLNDEIPY